MIKCPIIVGSNTITVFLSGKPYPFPLDSEKGQKVLELVKGGASEEDVLAYLTDESMKSYCDDMKSEGVVITDETILIDGEEISSSLADQIRRHYEDDLPIEPLVKFVQKVRLNPSYRIRNQLWLFIEASQNSGGFTLAEDGDILAYKKVRADYKDIHSGTFDNSVGKVVEMERKNVDDDPNNTCSSGLHFCAYSYLSSYGASGDDRVMLVKVNPADVVSIPTDYHNAKARCCRYEVVQEIEHIISQPVYSDYDCGEDVTDDWSDEEDNDVINGWREQDKEDYFEHYEDNFKGKDEEFLYSFLEEIGEDDRVPSDYTYNDCIKAIKDVLYDTDGDMMEDWHSFCKDKEQEEWDADFDEFLDNYTKRELINFYNFVTNKNYVFQKATKWKMVEAVKELFEEMPPSKDKNVFIKAWLASSQK